MKLQQVSPVVFREPLSNPPESLYIGQVEGKIGSFVVAGIPEGIVKVKFNAPLDSFACDLFISWGSRTIRDPSPLKPVLERLKAYLNGEPSPVEAVIQPVRITPFITSVHRILARIPYGETVTYSEIAVELGNPGAARAVGNACGRNDVLVIVPCHRVLAAEGLGGFSSGLENKALLLEHEKKSLFRKMQCG